MVRFSLLSPLVRSVIAASSARPTRRRVVTVARVCRRSPVSRSEAAMVRVRFSVAFMAAISVYNAAPSARCSFCSARPSLKTTAWSARTCFSNPPRTWRSSRLVSPSSSRRGRRSARSLSTIRPSTSTAPCTKALSRAMCWSSIVRLRAASQVWFAAASCCCTRGPRPAAAPSSAAFVRFSAAVASFSTALACACRAAASAFSRCVRSEDRRDWTASVLLVAARVRVMSPVSRSSVMLPRAPSRVLSVSFRARFASFTSEARAAASFLSPSSRCATPVLACCPNDFIVSASSLCTTLSSSSRSPFSLAINASASFFACKAISLVCFFKSLETPRIASRSRSSRRSSCSPSLALIAFSRFLSSTSNFASKRFSMAPGIAFSSARRWLVSFPVALRAISESRAISLRSKVSTWVEDLSMAWSFCCRVLISFATRFCSSS
mmetsp:Transcript_9902/g.22236  ORF Transcript_9902/g.22236 Transcript_9902/m.22236 type:complete len:437 (-) Transcript_9902:396-1706(-)